MNKKLLIIIVATVAIAGITALAVFKPLSWNLVKEESAKRVDPNSPPPEFAEVKAVADGSTILLDSGHEVRYLGVRVPSVGEEVQCFGREAVKANESVIGKQVRLEEDPLLKRSSDGAWVRYVYFEEELKPTPEATPAPEETPSISPSPEGEDHDEEEGPKEIFVNERILEGGFGFPLVSKEMQHGERMLSAARFASATGKGLWSRCEVSEDTPGQLETKKVEECTIKGKVTDDFQKVYRTEECAGYRQTVVLESQGGKWFCAEDIARDAGFEKAPDCP